MVVAGPNCMGFANLNLHAYTAFASVFKNVPPQTGPGRASIVTQSGNIGLNLTMQRRGLPLAYLITVGNKAGDSMDTIVAALFGSSWHVVSGPTNALSLALLSMLAPLALTGSRRAGSPAPLFVANADPHPLAHQPGVQDMHDQLGQQHDDSHMQQVGPHAKVQDALAQEQGAIHDQHIRQGVLAQEATVMHIHQNAQHKGQAPACIPCPGP